MAKKTRRVRRAPRLSAAQLVRPLDDGQPEAAPGAGTPAVAQRSVPQQPLVAAARPAAVPVQDLRQEYRYVIDDLKRIAVLAAVMLTGLIALALFVL